MIALGFEKPERKYHMHIDVARVLIMEFPDLFPLAPLNKTDKVLLLCFYDSLFPALNEYGQYILHEIINTGIMGWSLVPF